MQQQGEIVESTWLRVKNSRALHQHPLLLLCFSGWESSHWYDRVFYFWGEAADAPGKDQEVLLYPQTEGLHTNAHLLTSYLFILILLPQTLHDSGHLSANPGFILIFLCCVLPSSYSLSSFRSFSNFPFSGLSWPTLIPCTILLKSIKTLVSQIFYSRFIGLCKLHTSCM